MSSNPYRQSSGGPAILRLAPLLLVLIPTLALLGRGCQQGPFGRHQVVALSPTEESQLGAQAYRQVLTQNYSKVLPDNHPLSVRVREIGQRLVAAVHNPAFLKSTHLAKQDFQWEFRVVNENQLNAFCLPGGKVVVYTGIIPVCFDDTGLATVMGHEIGHALAHHGAERMAQQQLVRAGQAAVATQLRDMDMAGQQRLMAVLAAGANVGILLPFSRRHESEADRIGLYMMATAGYDPAEAAEFWKRMKAAAAKAGASRQPEFMSTHPDHERRAADLRSWTKDVEPLYLRSERQPPRRLPGPSGKLPPLRGEREPARTK